MIFCLREEKNGKTDRNSMNKLLPVRRTINSLRTLILFEMHNQQEIIVFAQNLRIVPYNANLLMCKSKRYGILDFREDDF